MAKTEKRKAEQTTEGVVATIEVPLGEPREGVYLSPHLELKLNAEQAEVLHRVTVGLQESVARLSNHRLITNTADAVRYLLESIGRIG